MNVTQVGRDGFGRALRDLKRDGCNVLVTGHLPSMDLHVVSSRLLGGEPGRRVRVFCLTNRGLETARRRLSLVQPGLGRPVVVDAVGESRSVAGAASDGLNLDIRAAPCGPGQLCSEVCAAVSGVESRHGPLEPAMLRLCLESLQPYVAECDRDAVRAFVADVGQAVVDVCGIGHYVLPAEQPSDRPSWLDPMFEVVVEHRVREDTTQQRWLLPSRDVATGWFPLA